MELEDSYHQHLYVPGQKIEAPKVRWIWNIFWILLAVTAVEVGLAYWNYLTEEKTGKPMIPHQTIKVIFIILTLAKAYFIIFSYMHLKDERKNFKLTLGIFVIIITYFIVLMMTEGYYQSEVHLHLPNFMDSAPGHGSGHLPVEEGGVQHH